MNLFLDIFISFILFILNKPLSDNPPLTAEYPCVCSKIEYAGTYMPYSESIQLHETEPPSGYTPFYINHIGRHGSQTFHSSETLDFVLLHLREARKTGKLTPVGKELHTHLQKLRSNLEGHWGELTEMGRTEQAGIAYRLVNRYPDLFKKSSTPLFIHAISSPINKCMNSMYCFVSNIKYLSTSNLIIKTGYNRANSPILDFFNQNSNYLRFYNKGNWRNRFEKFKQNELHSSRLLSLLFTPTYKISEEIQYKLILSLFSIRNTLLNQKSDFNIDELFTEADFNSLWQIENVRDYLSHAGSGEENFIALRIAAPLLMDMISSTDKAIHSQKQLATLRFAHAETLIPLIALMGIPEGMAHITNLEQLCRYWRNYEVAPMAANLQWVFYQNKNGNVLVKVLLNEKETTLPIESDLAPYYSWNKVKRYYSQQIIRILPTL